ncbi:MAG: ribose 5-phosphate isomerase B [Saprospiraceae bacterium]|nr:ribose 5-phosphate isomerase B [Saprospiraceae bacterium]
MVVAIGSDHAGFEYKEFIIKFLLKCGHRIIDFGTHNLESVDYPDFAHPTAEAIETSKAELGLLICGSGNGVCITANKHKDIRAALCWTVELAALARLHNNANVLCLPARFISKRMAKNIVEKFIETPFEGGRHARRVNKISV